MKQGNLKKILIISVWEEIWALDEGCGVPDELIFMDGLAGSGVEIHYMRPGKRMRIGDTNVERVHEYTYPDIFRLTGSLPGALHRLLVSLLLPGLIYRRIVRIAERIKPDLILGFSHHAIPPVSRAGRRLDIPTAVKLFGVMHLGREDENTFDYYYHNFDQINSLRFPVDHYLVLNDGTLGKKALMERGIPESRITFLQNGMNLEWADKVVDREKVRESFGLPRDKVLVVTLSRFVKSKRIGHLLKAASLLDSETLEKTVLVIAGDGPRKEHLHRLTESFGLSGKVIFTGAVPYENVPDLFKACDIFAGTNQLSNMTMPPCEAILCGIPVVAYDVAGTGEVVRDGETGLLAEDGNPGELAAGLAGLINNRPKRESIAEKAALFGREYFIDWKDRISIELDTLNKIAGG